MRAFKMLGNSLPHSRQLWLIVILLALLALPLGAQAQPPHPSMTASISNISANGFTLSWSQPVNAGPATGYRYQMMLPHDQDPVTTNANTRTATITGLAPGTFTAMW